MAPPGFRRRYFFASNYLASSLSCPGPIRAYRQCALQGLTQVGLRITQILFGV